MGHAAYGSREQSGRHGHVNEMKRLEMGWNDRGKAYIGRDKVQALSPRTLRCKMKQSPPPPNEAEKRESRGDQECGDLEAGEASFKEGGDHGVKCTVA